MKNLGENIRKWKKKNFGIRIIHVNDEDEDMLGSTMSYDEETTVTSTIDA